MNAQMRILFMHLFAYNEKLYDQKYLPSFPYCIANNLYSRDNFAVVVSLAVLYASVSEYSAICSLGRDIYI